MTHSDCPYTDCTPPPADQAFNLPLLRKGVEWVLEQVQLDIGDENRVWDQRVWTCGTEMCLAGYLAVEIGSSTLTDVNGQTDAGHVSDVAQRMLGIYECEADALWSGGNGAHSILYHARRIAAAHGEDLGP